MNLIIMQRLHILMLILMIVFLVTPTSAQVPTLTPEQTVNPSTGRMEFSLPLTTVKGRNGNDFPLALNYQSGIRLHDEASAFGLGFSCVPTGGLSEKVCVKGRE
jgi:hypothetical protein